jgi:small subunit ribosomal protein S6
LAPSAKRLYEGMFLVDSAVATANWDGVLAAIDTILKRADADVISVRKWDERRLCYDIARCKRGTYVLAYFRVNPTTLPSIERDIQLSELMLRAMMLRGDHLTQEMMDAPTPAMQAAAGIRPRPEAAGAESAVAGGDPVVAVDLEDADPGDFRDVDR